MCDPRIGSTVGGQLLVLDESLQAHIAYDGMQHCYHDSPGTAIQLSELTKTPQNALKDSSTQCTCTPC